MFLSKSKHTQLIKNKAKELGFDYCGISRADFLEEEAPRLENWLKNNNHGEMKWMENHFDKRLDPRKLVEGSKSVISFLLNYFPEEPVNHPLKISKYAYGKDYHTVIKDKLKELMLYMKQEIGDFSGRAFVDSAPVMDKAWAEKGGLGWRGKNSNLINPKAGSFFFIAELITDLDLEYDGPMKDYCGTCTKCIDACPTDAISQAYVVDGSKCISYLTIELKNNIPSDFKGKMDNWIFGCDVCQDVCPWNRFSKAHNEPQFLPSEEFKNLKEWTELTSELFDEVFKKTAIKRTKFEGLQRNIKFLA
ncbi:tRNA epoxyqueuosine(34) reductase QueG [Sporocytophaga myxococcoides]|uniref:tRNA epoxyqueuosine(34) reductase QueG n=1 Tax=Sporocytophaga myxococcoides TaxID=153721 RepID=UPI0003F5EE72|nr:tRNA epoxyqueuosine(34) reductase QueG [Sporocytophaga myxococcoides]